MTFRKSPVSIATVSVALVLTLTACATKKYARTQAETVNQRVTQIQTQTNEQIATLNTKHQDDMSQVNERIATTDQKVEQATRSAQQAGSTATQAKQTADANQAKITALAGSMTNALTFQVVDKGDVTFDFNKSTLTDEAKAELDQIILKVQKLPRSMVELVGFTDPIGSENYNMALSRRRADEVSRYLVEHKVPLVSIHAIGLGEMTPPEGLEADIKPASANPSKKEIDKIARRVRVRVYGAGEVSPETVARAQ